MKHILSIGLLAAFSLQAGAQLYETDDLLLFDLDGDKETDIKCGIFAGYYAPNNFYHVTSGAELTWTRGRFLHTADGLLDHSSGMQIDQGLPTYAGTPQGSPFGLGVVSYDWTIREPRGDLIITPVRDLFPTQLSCILAFKFESFDGWHVGWARFRRPSTELGIAYRFDGLGYNPFPDKPIRAGFPAELPPVHTTVSEDGQSLHLSWESGYPGVFLLATPDLTPPVEWTPVDLSGANEAVVPLPTEGQVFFKLVHEP